MSICYTPKQHALMEGIARYIQEKGYAPTLKEMGEWLGISLTTVSEHLRALIDKGAIRRPYKYEARSIEILDADFITPKSPEEIDKRVAELEAKLQRMDRHMTTQIGLICGCWQQVVIEEYGDVVGTRLCQRAIQRYQRIKVKILEKL